MSLQASSPIVYVGAGRFEMNDEFQYLSGRCSIVGGTCLDLKTWQTVHCRLRISCPVLHISQQQVAMMRNANGDKAATRSVTRSSDANILCELGCEMVMRIANGQKRLPA